MGRKLLLSACLCGALAAPAVAQEAINYASVGGRVTDQQGAVVPGAAVTARHTETNVTALATTDQNGRFRFPFLRVGPYEIRVHLQGFADSTRTLTLGVGSAFELPVVLMLAGIDTSVTAPKPRRSRPRAPRLPVRWNRPRRRRFPSTGGTSWISRCWFPASRRPTRRARSSSRKRPRFRARASR